MTTNARDYTPSSQPNATPLLLNVALAWLEQGIAPIPIYPGTKRPRVRWEAYQHSLPNVREVTRWFARRESELAIVCGWRGLTVLDFDDMAHYRDWRADFPDLRTFEIATVRGRHVYLFADDTRSFNVILDPQGEIFVEVRGPGRYVLAAPSLHPTGRRYKPVVVAPIAHVETLADVLPAAPEEHPPHIPGQTPQVLGLTGGQGVRSEECAAIKERVQLLPVARAVVESLRRSGQGDRWWSGRCPFHDDHNPSLWVDADRGRFGCRAPHCPAYQSGDVIDFWRMAHQVDLRAALDQLGALYG